MSETVEVKTRRPVKPRHIFRNLAGQPLAMKEVKKHFRDALAYHHGQHDEGKFVVTQFDPTNPLGGLTFVPGPQNPICQKCELFEQGADNPFIRPHGAEDPVLTIVFDSVSAKEDARGELAVDGPSGFLKRLLTEMNFDLSQVRWAPMTRCAVRAGKQPNYDTKGNWCRHYLVQDLIAHPPKLIMPVGSVALGLLSHKSNAQDWGGRLLTYRGWPDDWMTDAEYALPRPDPANPDGFITGHPLLGPAPTNLRIPMVPIQVPRMVYASQNPHVISRWKKHVEYGLRCAVEGVEANVYDKPWWKLSTDPDEIEEALMELIDNPGTLISYDTETTGVKPWALGANIVFMMFRWKSPVTGENRSIGFDWNYPESPTLQFIKRLSPVVLQALYSSVIVGHNITFDILFTAANVEGADLVKLADSAQFDTWHMAYVMRQQRGTLGLDMIAYQWVPDLAGYEEDMTLLIELLPDLLHPENGGHYARCPEDKRETHLKPYVMGDVEVAYEARDKIEEKLNECRTYRMPIAHHEHRGRFRWFTPPARNWVYKNVVSPAARMLMKQMGRGMFVDVNELKRQEDIFPKKIREARLKLRNVDEKIVTWCEQMEATEPGWELDLENKGQLKEILFRILELPVQRLTVGGRKVFGEDADLASMSKEELIEYAALDKYTLNMMSVNHPEVRPLQEYRKVFKEYSTYIRPMRNLFTQGLDKRKRKTEQHLARDSCVHASFLLTGTRGGRLSCKDPNLQQLPRDGLIKRIYTSRFGVRGCMYQGDLSQIELRLLAAACGDESMVRAYLDNIDLHALTHSKIYRKRYEECTNEYAEWLQHQGRTSEAKKWKEERKVAKTVNFLTGYGGGAFGLQTSLASQGIYMTIEECESILESFFDAYPALRKYLSYYKNFIQESGVAVSILGRVRIFEEVFSDDNEAKNKALRAGCNHLIQSTASDMMLLCLTVIENVMRAEGLESMLVSTVHDSLLIDAVRTELPVVHSIVNEVLNNIPAVMKAVFGADYDTSWCIVPFAGDCEVGHNYLDAKKISAVGEVDWTALLAA